MKKKSKNAGWIIAAISNLVIGVLRKAGRDNPAKARRYYEIQFVKGYQPMTQPIIL